MIAAMFGAKEGVGFINNRSCHKGWTLASLSNEAGFGISIMDNLESTEDAVGDVIDKVITKSTPYARKDLSTFERRGVRSQLVKKDRHTLATKET